MLKILFLCHGNICRSPMAEYVMKKMIADAGLGDYIQTKSRALHHDEIGSGVYPPVKKLLDAEGIDCNGHHATLMKASDYDEFDYIVVMDDANVRDAQRLSNGDPQKKIYKLLQFVILENVCVNAYRFGSNIYNENNVKVLPLEDAPDVADPWYTRNFDLTWHEVNAGCKALLYKIARDNQWM